MNLLEVGTNAVSSLRLDALRADPYQATRTGICSFTVASISDTTYVALVHSGNKNHTLQPRGD